MIDALEFIHIYSNQSQVGNQLIEIIGSPFPVSDSCERNVTLGGESYIKLSFTIGARYVIPAFSFIIYDGEIYFCREAYSPSPKGDSYVYEVKFVSFDNMLNKMICFRHVIGPDDEGTQQEWDEPQFELNGGLGSIMQIVIDSLHSAANRYDGFFAYLLRQADTVQSELDAKEEMLTFSYDSKKITEVLSDIANQYEIDYWFEFSGAFETGYNVTLHMCTCERTDKDLLELSDEFEYQRGQLKPLRSKGLLDCSYTQEWTGAIQRLIGYGSERNITRKHTIDDDKFVAYGKRLRLRYAHSCVIAGITYQHAYAVKDEDGTLIPLTVINKAGAIQLSGVNTGEESTEKFDDIYPRGFMRVVDVTQRGTDNPIYTVYTKPTEYRDGEYVDMTDAQIDAMQADPEKKLFPIEIEEGQTLAIYFFTGYLSGREFNVADKSAMMRYDSSSGKYVIDPVNGHWMGVFEIEPEGDNQDSAQIPFGTFVPRAKESGGYEGDILSMFNMVMPKFYMDSAENELAQAIYDKGQEILNTRPEVKCDGDPEFFMTRNIFLGERIAIQSKKFFEDDTRFVSRVTQFNHSLTKPFEISFKICSAQIKGTISQIKHEIADHTSDIQGVQQSAKNLSRRAYNDAKEMSEMLQTLAAEMMVVGVDKNQFSFTMGINIINGNYVSGVNHFAKLSITAGEIQHTQEPYIKDANNGLYSVAAQDDLHTDIHGNSINSNTVVTVAAGVTFTPRLEPFYVYAQLGNGTTRDNTATIVLVSLTEEKYLAQSQRSYGENENYLLLGTLSSEFDDFNNTAFRVFNRTNGYTQIAGGTITTEQIQDPTRSLIIDLSSNPPRLIAARGAEIIGHIKFLSADGGIKTVDQVVNEEVDKIKIGGENIYQGEPDITIKYVGSSHSYEKIGLGIRVVAGATYVVSAEAIHTASTYSKVSIRLISGSNEKTVIEFGNSSEHVEKSFIVDDVLYDNADMYITANYQGSSSNATVSKLMVQFGNKATDYHEYVKHLAESFLNQARAGSTDIEGGLLMTNILQLRNEQGNVTAGMSGLSGTQQTPENVLLWGGGTYADAIHADDPNDEYKKEDGSLIQTLLKKDGTGKIGVFYVEEDKVLIKTPNGIIAIDDDKGILMYRGTDLTVPPYVEIRPNAISADELPQYKDYTTSIVKTTDTPFPSNSPFRPNSYLPRFVEILTFTPLDDNNKLTISQINIHITLETARLTNVAEMQFIDFEPQGDASSWGIKFTLEMRIDGNTISSFSRTKGVTSTGSAGLNDTFTLPPKTITNINGSNHNVSIYLKAMCIHWGEESDEFSVRIPQGTDVTYTLACTEFSINNEYNKTLIGTNGILAAHNGSNYFFIDNSADNKQKITIKGLPDVEHANPGQLYKDSNGYLKIR